MSIVTVSFRVVMLGAALIGSPSDEAAALADKAREHFAVDELDEAAAALAKAYELDPDPYYAYDRAQVERLRGNCKVAIDLYDKFIEAKVDDEDTTAKAKVNRQRCEEELRESGELEPEATAPPPAPPTTPDEPPTRPPKSDAWYRDPLGGALVGTGAVATVVGAGVLGIAIANDREAPEAPTEKDFIETKDKAQVRQRAGIAVLSIGAALLAAGAVRWGLLGAGVGTKKTRASVTMGDRSAVFVLQGRF